MTNFYATFLGAFLASAGRPKSAQRPCPGGHELGHHGDGDLLRRVRADAQTDGAADLVQGRIADALRTQRLVDRGFFAAAADHTNIEGVRFQGLGQDLTVEAVTAGHDGHIMVPADAAAGRQIREGRQEWERRVNAERTVAQGGNPGYSLASF